METQHILFNNNPEELKYASGKFQIKDIKVEKDIDYSPYRIYCLFHLKDEEDKLTFKTKTWEFEEIENVDNYFKFRPHVIPDTCFKATVSVLPSLPFKHFRFDIIYWD